MATYILVTATILALICSRSTSGLVPVTNSVRNKIAFEVLKVSPVNTVVSTIALKMPLCQLLAVATGDAKTELLSALGISREDQEHTCYDAIRKQVMIAQITELMMHNKIFLNDSLDVDPGFTINSFRQFGVKVDRVGFRYPKAASKYINRWIATETLNRVSTLIDEDDININTSMVVLNGIHFKGSWESPFDIRFTENMFFRDETNKLWKIPMMTKVGYFNYVDEVNYHVTVLNMKFTSMGASITMVMPEKRTDLQEFLDKLSTDPLLMDKLRNRLTSKYMKIHLPRIKIKTYVDWTDFLRLIGINKILDPDNSGLNGILKNGATSDIPVHLSKAKQKVFLDIDEFGLHRYMKQIDAHRAREEKEFFMLGDTGDEVTLDQPFYFAISLEINRVHHDLFNGVFRRPDEG